MPKPKSSERIPRPTRADLAGNEATLDETLRCLVPSQPSTGVVVLMVVEYDRFPTSSELGELRDQANQYGGTVYGKMRFIKPQELIDFKNE